MKKSKLSIATAITAPVMAGAMLTMASMQASAATVEVTITDLQVTASVAIVTTLNTATAGTGEWTVTGTGIGDATVVSGAWGGGTLDTTINAFGAFNIDIVSTNQRVNYSDTTTAAPAAIVNTSPGFSSVTCAAQPGSEAFESAVCVPATGVADPGPYVVVDGPTTLNTNGASDTTTITFTSFTDTENFAGNIVTFSDDGAGTTRTTTYSFETVAAIPVPAAAWLFGSALLGLAGVSRKRKA